VLHDRRDEQLGCNPADKDRKNEIKPADRPVDDPVGDPTGSAGNNAAGLGSNCEY